MRVWNVLFIGMWLCALAMPTGAGRVAAKITPRVRLNVHIAHVFDGKPLHMEAVRLRNRAGNSLSVTRLAYFVSGLTLRRADGRTIAFPDQVAYLNPAEGRDTFILNDVPAGRYFGVSFHIGLPPRTNHADPSRYAADSPLHPLVNRLHWGWQGGYVFLALEGRYWQANGRLGGYSYHLATDRNLMTPCLQKPFRLEKDSAINIDFDVARMFAGRHVIDLQAGRVSETTHSVPGDGLAARLKTNVESAFRLANVTPQASSLSIRAARHGNPVHAARHGKAAVVMPAAHTTPYPFPQPSHFPQAKLPQDNPLTMQGVALGQKLFFEKRLSGNNTQSCASCHQPRYAFANGGKAVSIGIDGKPGTRRAMPLFNLAWQPAFTWEGRRTRLRDQALAPIQDVREMHQSLPQTVAKLQQDGEYPMWFAEAFGSSEITAARIGLALEQYLLTLVSGEAKFDRALRGEAEFTDEEKRGLLLFITEYDPIRGKTGADCFHCHGGNLFSDYQFRNNGLDVEPKDAGRFLVTGREADRGKFKTPSLRNVELTAPYMHDGRFRTLEEAIRHYTTGVQRSDTLDPNIAKHPDEGMALSEEDVKALAAFLKTLTDMSSRSGH